MLENKGNDGETSWLDACPGARRVAYPVVLIVAVTVGWAAVTACAGSLGVPLAVAALALLLALHSSLQHEVIHGHPTGVRAIDEALVFPAFGLLVPYGRFRDQHLAHHHDPLLTDPYDDPESNYLDPAVWLRLPRPVRALLAANNTLLGRMAIGPFVGTFVLWRDDWRAFRAGNRGVGRAWVLHGLALVPVAAWLGLAGTMPLLAYLLGCWGGLAILRIRTFLEHQAHARAAARSVIIEDRGPLAFLFLNNNFHAVHHAHPRLPWYRLPGEYARRREHFLRKNGGYRYRSYGAVFARHLFRRKDPVAHPIWAPRRVSGVAALPMYDWPEIAGATDALWAAIRGRLRAEGVAAPERLTRGRGLAEVWTDPGLVLGQTCGLPLVERLGGRVAVVGALDYGLPGCAPGWYRSVVVARRDEGRARARGVPRRDAGGQRDRIRSRGGGRSSTMRRRWPRAGASSGAVVVTGAHADSVRAVAAGTADLAAIDMVSWRTGAALPAGGGAAGMPVPHRSDAGAAADRGGGERRRAAPPGDRGGGAGARCRRARGARGPRLRRARRRGLGDRRGAARGGAGPASRRRLNQIFTKAGAGSGRGAPRAGHRRMRGARRWTLPATSP